MTLALTILSFLSYAIDPPDNGSKKKIGVIYKVVKQGAYRLGEQGAVDVLLTPDKKFLKGLAVMDEKVNPTELMKSGLQELFEMNNRTIEEIDAEYRTDNLSKFKKPNSAGVKFHKYDVRRYKDYGIDELLIVELEYGMAINYYGFIELQKWTTCAIRVELVDLNSNAVIHKRSHYKKVKVKKGWNTPPNYEPLNKAMGLTISKVLKALGSKVQLN